MNQFLSHTIAKAAWWCFGCYQKVRYQVCTFITRIWKDSVEPQCHPSKQSDCITEPANAFCFSELQLLWCLVSLPWQCPNNSAGAICLQDPSVHTTENLQQPWCPQLQRKWLETLSSETFHGSVGIACFRAFLSGIPGRQKILSLMQSSVLIMCTLPCGQNLCG